MGRPAPDLELVRRTLALVRSGLPLEDAAAQAHVSTETIRRWRHKYPDLATPKPAAPPPAPPPAAAAPTIPTWPPQAELVPPPLPAAAAAPLSEIDPDADALTTLRELMRDTRRAQAAAQQGGDLIASGRHAAVAARLAPVLARLERQATDGGDGVRILRRDLDAARARWRERVARLLEQPLCCASCGRALRVTLAGGTLEASEAEPPPAGHDESGAGAG